MPRERLAAMCSVCLSVCVSCSDCNLSNKCLRHLKLKVVWGLLAGLLDGPYALPDRPASLPAAQPQASAHG